MRNEDKKLTSLRLDPQLYETFKEQCAKDRFSLQKLASRAMFLYLTDIEFKKRVYNQSITKLSK
jgi:hypothetical protein